MSHNFPCSYMYPSGRENITVRIYSKVNQVLTQWCNCKLTVENLDAVKVDNCVAVGLNSSRALQRMLTFVKRFVVQVICGSQREGWE